jgi:uncharacterized protein (DUF2235 family)
VPPALKPRRLVLCLDGTWNSAYSQRKRSDGHAVLKPSNVLKLARSVVPDDAATGRSQLVYYDIGVGSLAKYPGVPNRVLAVADKGLGGVWGAGFEGNVEDALAFLANNHVAGDEVFVFGFSRGAATAQAVTRFLDWAGGLPTKRDVYYLAQLFRDYVVSRGARTRTAALAKINEQRAAERKPLAPLDPFEPVRVEVLGVWDTVMALGSRFRARGEHTSTVSRSFHVGASPPACVQHARQALAIDEVRFDFRPEIWTKAAPGQTLEQRWFAGVHSNVGGGYVDDGLANLAFTWMLGEATSHGLAVDVPFTKKYNGYAQDRLYRSESIFFRGFDAARRRAGRGERSLVGQPATANLKLDRSVLWRICTDPKKNKKTRPGELVHPDFGDKPYRPDNVLRFLAAQPDLDAYLATLPIDPTDLPQDVRRRIEELRKKKRKKRWRLSR